MRGYDREAAAVDRFLREEEGSVPQDAGAAAVAFEVVGETPGIDPSKPPIRLRPEIPAGRAVRDVLRAYLEAALANEDGVRRDLDPEFLHDFRVSVRRSRSVLGRLSRVLDRPAAKHLAKELSWLGGATGEARDLDVFLEKIVRYAEDAVDTFGPGLTPLVRFLEERKKSARRELVATLASARYRDLVTTWTRFVEHGAEERETAPRSRRPVIDVVSKQIRRLHARMIEDGRAIGPDSPVEELHELRIRGKKLRYLLDGFRSLYYEEGITALVKHLKRLQDCLGDLNDLGVQQEMLAKHARNLADREDAGADTILAIGRLIEELERRARRERDRFAERFAGFDTPGNLNLVQELTRAREDGGSAS
jgi:CHAD domain-containing protein